MQCPHGFDDLVQVDATPRTRLVRHLAVEAQRVGRQAEAALNGSDDLDHGAALRIVERVLTRVEVADHLEHERSRLTAAIVTRGAGRRLVPVPARPDRAVRGDRDVLRDVAEAAFLCVELVHRVDGREPLVLRPVRPPGVVHVNHTDGS